GGGSHSELRQKVVKHMPEQYRAARSATHRCDALAPRCSLHRPELLSFATDLASLLPVAVCDDVSCAHRAPRFLVPLLQHHAPGIVMHSNDAQRGPDVRVPGHDRLLEPHVTIGRTHAHRPKCTDWPRGA